MQYKTNTNSRVPRYDALVLYAEEDVDWVRDTVAVLEGTAMLEGTAAPEEMVVGTVGREDTAVGTVAGWARTGTHKWGRVDCEWTYAS